MARVKDMLETQKAIIHVLWEAGKFQNEIAIQVVCSQSAISKITRQSCSKWSNCGFKPKTTARDEHQLNKIFISS